MLKANPAAASNARYFRSSPFRSFRQTCLTQPVKIVRDVGLIAKRIRIAGFLKGIGGKLDKLGERFVGFLGAAQLSQGNS